MPLLVRVRWRDSVYVYQPDGTLHGNVLLVIGLHAGSAADEHPRALRLTETLIGHLIKFKIKPARRDGDVGHMESSRPTPEIAPASESSILESRALAAAQRAARTSNTVSVPSQ
jgi:hypothetical protein